MENSLEAYRNHQVNAVRAIVSREILPNGVECIYVTVDDEIVYTFFDGKQKNLENPKHAGGKKPYLMLSVDRIEELRQSGIKDVEEVVGFVVLLGDTVDWNTGRIRHKRSKAALTYADLVERTGSKRKLDRILGKLEAEELVFKTSEGYVISRKIIKKGADRMANRVTTYSQAFEDLINVPLSPDVVTWLKGLEEQGHTEKSICYAIWKSQEKLNAFRRDPRFKGILMNEIRKYSWTKDDPRWKEYSERKALEKQIEAAQAEIKAKRRNVRKISASV